MAWWAVALQVVQYMQAAYQFNEAYERDDVAGMAGAAAGMGKIKTPSTVGQGLKAVAAREYPTEVKQVGQAITGKTVAGALKGMATTELEEKFPEGAAAYKTMRKIQPTSSQRLLVTEEEEEF